MNTDAHRGTKRPGDGKQERTRQAPFVIIITVREHPSSHWVE